MDATELPALGDVGEDDEDDGEWEIVGESRGFHTQTTLRRDDTGSQDPMSAGMSSIRPQTDSTVFVAVSRDKMANFLFEFPRIMCDGVTIGGTAITIEEPFCSPSLLYDIAITMSNPQDAGVQLPEEVTHVD